MTDDRLDAAERAIGYTFTNRGYLVESLRHASIADRRLDSNERMEFLGDAVLGMIASERIYQLFPTLLEGEMTKIKSTAVSRQTCARISRELGLHEYLELGKGMLSQSRLPQSLAAAVLESVIAAIYLDGGFEAARNFIGPLLEPRIRQAAVCGHQENFKSVLQQYAQQNLGDTPSYRVLDEKGPDHAKCFKIGVEIGPRRFDAKWGQSKKQAEQLAALAALQDLGVVEKSEDGVIHVVEVDAK
ncbi:MAG: ribonuclease III [Phycisphaerales bacterium JB039]